MQLNYWAPHVTVAAIIHREGKFLLVEENVPDKDNTTAKKVINQPAGHLENNESLFDAVVRETLEETRWEFNPSYISGIYRWIHDNGETYLRICFVGDAVKEHKELKLDTGIERAIWLTENEIREHSNLRSPLVIKSIEDYLAGQKFPLYLIQDIK
jgi:ADP-ribose pyrophosphatase YjhB (NUDIX family)